MQRELEDCVTSLLEGLEGIDGLETRPENITLTVSVASFRDVVIIGNHLDLDVRYDRTERAYVEMYKRKVRIHFKSKIKTPWRYK